MNKPARPKIKRAFTGAWKDKKGRVETYGGLRADYRPTRTDMCGP